MKNWQNVKDIISYPESGILSRELLKTNLYNTTLFCMAKSTEITQHTSTKEGFVYVIEGEGNFNLEGENIPMSSGVFIFFKKNAAHALKAETNLSFILSLSNN